MTRVFESRAKLVKAVQAAEESWSRGAWAEALEAYTEILRGRLDELRDAGALVSALRALDLVVIERVADLAVPFGFLRAADRLLEGYVAVTSAAGNFMAADYAALKRVHLALGDGRLNDAIARLEEMSDFLGDIHQIRFESEALERWEAERPWREFESDDRAVLFTRLYLVLGRLLASVGQYQDGLAALARGARHASPEAPDLARRALLPLELDTASALIEKGDIPQARAQLAALNDSRELDSRLDAAIRRDELSGKLALLTGDLGTARRTFSQTLGACRARGFRRAAMHAALNLAHVSIYLNQTAAARELLNHVIEEAAGENDVRLLARADHLIRVARARATSLADGVAIAPPLAQFWDPVSPRTAPGHAAARGIASSTTAQAASYLAFFEDQALEFYARLADEGPQSAASHLGAMRAVFDTTDSELIHVRLRALAGFSAYYLERYAEAVELLKSVIARLTALSLRPELWQVLRFVRWSLVRMGSTGPEVLAVAEEAQSHLQHMIGSLAPEDRTIFLLNKWTAEEEFLGGQIDTLSRGRDRVAASPWLLRPWRRIALWRRLDAFLRFLDRSRAIGHRLSVHQGAQANDRQPKATPSLWRRLLMHPRDRAVLSFLVLPDRVFLACSRWCWLDFCVSPVTRLELRENVGRWHEAIASTGASASAANRAAGELAGILQLPGLLDRLPRRVRALSIVPDDCLHGVPFAAVIHRGNFLIERFALSIGLECERPWHVRRASKALRRTGAAGRALLVGVSRGTSSIMPLPGVESELDGLARWLAARSVETNRIENDQADKAAVLDGLCRSTLAHLACHGVFEVERPDASGLVLLPASDRMEVLSIGDLARTDLTNLHHVTLSACWSADKFVLPGRQVISLPETLYRAGAHSVLGSLWRVDDVIAVALMRRFYDYLENHPRDEALRRAQLDCFRGKLLSDPDAFASHPIAWAGFTLSGDPRPLNFVLRRARG
jgi:hypothetical protein